MLQKKMQRKCCVQYCFNSRCSVNAAYNVFYIDMYKNATQTNSTVSKLSGIRYRQTHKLKTICLVKLSCQKNCPNYKFIFYLYSSRLFEAFFTDCKKSQFFSRCHNSVPEKLNIYYLMHVCVYAQISVSKLRSLVANLE